MSLSLAFTSSISSLVKRAKKVTKHQIKRHSFLQWSLLGFSLLFSSLLFLCYFSDCFYFPLLFLLVSFFFFLILSVHNIQIHLWWTFFLLAVNHFSHTSKGERLRWPIRTFFPVRHWNKLPREMVHAPSLKVSKVILDRAVSKLI